MIYRIIFILCILNISMSAYCHNLQGCTGWAAALILVTMIINNQKEQSK